MTYGFKFDRDREPTIELGLRGVWGGLSATLVRASAGRHLVPGAVNHRLLFYTSGPVRADCRCDTLHSQRLQQPGEFDLLPAGADGVWDDDGPSEMVSLHIAPILVAAAAEALALPPEATFAPVLGARDPHVEFLVRAIIAEMQTSRPAGRLYVEALGVALTTRLLQTSADLTRSGTRSMLSKPQLRRINDYIETHLDRDLSLGAIAKIAGLSVGHLTGLFRRTTGQTVHSYVLDCRVRQAKRLLLAGEVSIAQIALQTGFAHQSHLATCLRRRLGLSPSELRREGRPGSAEPTGAKARAGRRPAAS